MAEEIPGGAPAKSGTSLGYKKVTFLEGRLEVTYGVTELPTMRYQTGCAEKSEHAPCEGRFYMRMEYEAPYADYDFIQVVHDGDPASPPAVAYPGLLPAPDRDPILDAARIPGPNPFHAPTSAPASAPAASQPCKSAAGWRVDAAFIVGTPYYSQQPSAGYGNPSLRADTSKNPSTPSRIGMPALLLDEPEILDPSARAFITTLINRTTGQRLVAIRWGWHYDTSKTPALNIANRGSFRLHGRRAARGESAAIRLVNSRYSVP